MRRILLGFVLLLLLQLSWAGAPPQGDSIPMLHLGVVSTTPVQGTSGHIFDAVRCDVRGNIYLRFYDQLALQAPVMRISSDGQKKQVFSTESAPDYQGAEIFNFAVEADGTVALATHGPKAHRGQVLLFDDDGAFDPDDAIKMGPANILQIAAFSNGNLLVSGVRSNPLRPAASVPFTEIVDRAGNVVKELLLPGDYAPPKPSDTGFEDSLRKLPDEITLGDAISASDGNVYLARQGADYTVYVIGADGSLLRKIRLAAPNGYALIGGVYYSAVGGGRLAVTAQNTRRHTLTRLISIYSAETGERLMDYDAPREVGSSLACYTANSFTFLGSTKEHWLAINEVKPE